MLKPVTVISVGISQEKSCTEETQIIWWTETYSLDVSVPAEKLWHLSLGIHVYTLSHS